MKDNESIISIFEIKRQIPLAKVRIGAIHPVTNAIAFRTGFASKDELPANLVRAYYKKVSNDVLNPFEADAEAIANL